MRRLRPFLPRASRTAHALLVLVLFAVTPAHAYFNDPDDACSVHKVRATTLGSHSYRELCSPRYYPSLFNPQTQYGPTAVVCPAVTGIERQDLRWPVCVTPTGGIDLGYRYPRRVNQQSQGITQDPAVDWWRVCATSDLSTVTSDPTAGPAPCAVGEEIGLCLPSAHYYERIDNGQLKTPGVRFYDFVLTHADCQTEGAPACSNCNDADGCTDICGHETFSVIHTCKALCQRYFGRLRFHVGATAAASDWEIVTGANTPVLHCDQSPSYQAPPNGTLANTCVNLQGYCNAPPGAPEHPTCNTTPLEICINDCGPPFHDWTNAVDSPPWVSTLGTKPSWEKNNHWQEVSFGRPWNPNTNQDNWLRSYAVNRDKAHAPSNVCGDAVAKYCNAVIPLGSGDATAKRSKCKDNILPQASWDFPVPPGDANGNEGGPFSFCDHFFFANMLCPETCTAGGTDAAPATQHFCGDIGGILGTHSCRAEGGSDEAATCCGPDQDPPCPGRDFCCPTETMPCP